MLSGGIKIPRRICALGVIRGTSAVHNLCVYVCVCVCVCVCVVLWVGRDDNGMNPLRLTGGLRLALMDAMATFSLNREQAEALMKYCKGTIFVTIIVETMFL